MHPNRYPAFVDPPRQWSHHVHELLLVLLSATLLILGNRTMPELQQLTNTTLDDCLHLEMSFLAQKVYLVAVCGSLITIVSVLGNVLLFYVFTTRPRFRNTHFFYMWVLSFFDIFMAVSYAMLMIVHVLIDYYKSLTLYYLWLSYVVPMFVVSHITMTSSSFLIVAASIERLFKTLSHFYNAWFWMQEHRAWVAASALLIGVLTKGSIFFELTIIHKPYCENFSEFELTQTALSANINGTYVTVWKFYITNIVTVLLPFALLIYCNLSIVISLRRQKLTYKPARRRSEKGSHAGVMRARAHAVDMTLGSATRILSLVVLCYLVANVLNVCLTIWEYIDRMALLGDYWRFYTFSTDMVSLLTVLATALRLPIYCYCNEGILRETKDILGKFCCRKEEQNNRKQVRLAMERSRWTNRWNQSWQGEESVDSKKQSSTLLTHIQNGSNLLLVVHANDNRSRRASGIPYADEESEHEWRQQVTIL